MTQFNSKPTSKNPSGILTEIRQFTESSYPPGSLASNILYDFEFAQLDNPTYDTEEYRRDAAISNGYGEPEARDHARKVLTRLKNLQEA